ncbi:MAG: serine hydrolase, partial [Opitutus sp.]
YSVVVPTGSGSATSAPAILGIASTAKVEGEGTQVGEDIKHPNGNIFDQILLEGIAATITADPGQITRLSYVDLTNDIVQVEFCGAGSLSVVLEGAAGPANPVNYNQGIGYMRGHASIVISGADESTNVTVFSVGPITAVDQTLFRDDVTYDGIADLGFIAISSRNGRFGAVRTANVSYFGTKGLTGVYAPGVQFTGPVYVHDIRASDAANPVLAIESCEDVRVTGGNLAQANGRSVQLDGIVQIQFTAGCDSHGNFWAPKLNRAVLECDGTDVTSKVIAYSGP